MDIKYQMKNQKKRRNQTKKTILKKGEITPNLNLSNQINFLVREIYNFVTY